MNYQHHMHQRYGLNLFYKLNTNGIIDILQAEYITGSTYKVSTAQTNLEQLQEEYDIGYVSNYGEVPANPIWQDLVEIDWEVAFGENLKWIEQGYVQKWEDMTQFISNLHDFTPVLGFTC